jgi:hypothetical protein
MAGKERISEELNRAKLLLQSVPLAVDEVISSLARCELIRDNIGDRTERYFADEAARALGDLGEQLITIAAHPHLEEIINAAMPEETDGGT